MVNNGSAHYDHDRDGTHTMIGGCEVKFRNMEHDTFIAIRYENDVLTGAAPAGNIWNEINPIDLYQICWQKEVLRKYFLPI